MNHIFRLCSAICLSLGRLEGIVGDCIDMNSKFTIKWWCTIVEMETQEYLSLDKFDDG